MSPQRNTSPQPVSASPTHTSRLPKPHTSLAPLSACVPYHFRNTPGPVRSTPIEPADYIILRLHSFALPSPYPPPLPSHTTLALWVHASAHPAHTMPTVRPGHSIPHELREGPPPRDQPSAHPPDPIYSSWPPPKAPAGQRPHSRGNRRGHTERTGYNEQDRNTRGEQERAAQRYYQHGYDIGGQGMRQVSARVGCYRQREAESMSSSVRLSKVLHLSSKVLLRSPKARLP